MYVIVLLLALLGGLLCGLLCGCSSNEESSRLAGEYIYRKAGEYHFLPVRSKMAKKEPYPWEEGRVGKYPKITKEFFRCKGNPLNPPRKEVRQGETITLNDCGGAEKHSLPLITPNKEGVYPILIDLLNFIQAQTKKRVVITSGHRCPEHNAYVDPSPAHQTSKHMIGAEVTFYVQGLENSPETLIKLIQAYYLQDPKTKHDKKYTEFKRYEKEDTGVTTQPWMNHEVFIKLFKKKEGRDFDNRHPYPYLSIQVRTDRATGERVIYTWDKAYNNYLRY